MSEDGTPIEPGGAIAFRPANVGDLDTLVALKLRMFQDANLSTRLAADAKQLIFATYWRWLEWIAVACLVVSLLLGTGMLLHPVLATPSGLAVLLFLTVWSLLVGWLPWTRGKVKSTAALAALLASTVWTAPPLVQILGVQSSVVHWVAAVIGLLQDI